MVNIEYQTTLLICPQFASTYLRLPGSSAIDTNVLHTYHDSYSEGMQPGDAVKSLEQLSQISNDEQVQINGCSGSRVSATCLSSRCILRTMKHEVCNSNQARAENQHSSNEKSLARTFSIQAITVLFAFYQKLHNVRSVLSQFYTRLRLLHLLYI